MLTVWRFEFPARDRDTHPEEDIAMPRGARVLAVRGNDLWAQVESGAPPELRRVRFVGTGREVPVLGRYVGTVFEDDKVPLLVWHVYDCGAVAA